MKTLIVHECVPCPDRSGCDLRIMEMLRALKRYNHEITFVARSPARYTDRYDILESEGIPCFVGEGKTTFQIHENWFGSSQRFRRILDSKFDLAILLLWFWDHITVPDDFCESIRRGSPHTRIVVLTDDRQGLRQQRIADRSRSFVDQELAYDFKERETQIYQAADAVVTIADAERDYVLTLVPDASVHTLPFSLPLRPSKVPFESRNDVLFLADFDNDAGRDAMEWFLSSAWNIVLDHRTDIWFDIAGNNSMRLQTNSCRNVRNLGCVADLEWLFSSHKLFVSPLRFGTGIATKNVLAMSHGVPVITTPVGAESLGPVDGAVLISSGGEPFAKSILNHYDDCNWWNAASRKSLQHISAHFSREAVDKIVGEIISLILDAPIRSALSPNCSYAYPNRGLPLESQIDFAESLLRGGKVRHALAELRYALYRIKNKHATQEYARIVAVIGQCKDYLGDTIGAEMCRTEQQRIGSYCDGC